MFKRLLHILVVTLGLGILAQPIYARGQFFGYVQKGGNRVNTSGQLSSNQVQLSYPGATVKVCVAGTGCSATLGTLATLFSDAGGTSLGNPLTAGTDGSFSFWTDTAAFDIVFYGKGITTQCGSSFPGYSCISAFTWPSMAWNGSTFSPTFSVLSFGAKCDGTTNDIAAFNAATTAADAADGKIEIPATVSGCYISSPWNFNSLSNVTISGDGYGSWIKCGVGANACMGGSTLTNVVLNNFRVAGTSSRSIVLGASGTSSSGVKVRHIWQSGASIADAVNSVYGLIVWNCTDCSVEDSNFSGNGPGSVAYDTSDLIFNSTLADTGHVRPRIVGNTATSTGVNLGIACFDCTYGEISGNFVSGTITRTGGTVSGYGILLYDASALGTRAQHMVVEHNRVQDVQGSGIYVAGGGTIGFHTINDNNIENAATTLAETSVPVGCIAVQQIFGSTISNNTCRASGKHGIDISSSQKLTVVGNYIQLPTSNAISLRGGTVADVTISGNTGTGCSSGIGVYSGGVTINSVLIADNHMFCTNLGIDFNLGVAATGTGDTISNNNLVGSASPFIDTGSLTSPFRENNRYTTGAMSGTAILGAGGTVTVSTTEIKTGDNVLLTNVTAGGTLGTLSLGTIVDATSFVINSSNAADTSTVFWKIVH